MFTMNTITMRTVPDHPEKARTRREMARWSSLKEESDGDGSNNLTEPKYPPIKLHSRAEKKMALELEAAEAITQAVFLVNNLRGPVQNGNGFTVEPLLTLLLDTCEYGLLEVWVKRGSTTDNSENF
jgi:hypothetical protein